LIVYGNPIPAFTEGGMERFLSIQDSQVKKKDPRKTARVMNSIIAVYIRKEI
jgi:hypothetical protein